MGNAPNRWFDLARWFLHKLPDICEGTTTKTGGAIAYSVARSVGQFTNREAGRSEGRSPPAAFAHAFASQSSDRVPTPLPFPLPPQSCLLVSSSPRPSP